jgi:GNAT superfamily N-acetyltransferase
MLTILKRYPKNYKNRAIEYHLLRDNKDIGHVISFWPNNKPIDMFIINIDDEKDRGKGYGKILMDKFLADADKTGRDVVLHVEGRGGSKDKFIAHAERNVKFYKKFGFEILNPSWKKSSLVISGPFMARQGKKW